MAAMHEGRRESQDSFREVLTAQLAKLRDCLVDEHEKQVRKVTTEAFLRPLGRSGKPHKHNLLAKNETGYVNSLGLEDGRSKSIGHAHERKRRKSEPRIETPDMGEKLFASESNFFSSMPLGSSFLPTKKAQFLRGDHGRKSDHGISSSGSQSPKSVVPTSPKFQAADSQELPGLVDTPEENEDDVNDDTLIQNDVPLPPLLSSAPPPPQRPPVALMSSSSTYNSSLPDEETAYTDDFSSETGFTPCHSRQQKEEKRHNEPPKMTKRKSQKSGSKQKSSRIRKHSVATTTSDATSLARLKESGSERSLDSDSYYQTNGCLDIEDTVSELISESDSDSQNEFHVLACWQRRYNGSRRMTNSMLQIAEGVTGKDAYHASHMMIKRSPSERQEKSKVMRCLIFLVFSKVPPSARFNFFWDLCGLLMLLYDVFTVPLELFMLPDYLFVDVMSWVVCIFWTAHILKTFRTGYISTEGEVEMNSVCIARRYAQTWLPLDALCAIADWVAMIKASTSQTDSTDIAHGVLLMPRMLRSVRLARLMRASEVEGFITEHLRSEAAGVFANVAKIIVLLLALTHVIACVWYFIGYHLDGGIDDEQEGWVRKIGMQRAPFWEKYVCSLNWALAQFVGESILELHTSSERLFNIFVILFAFVFSSLFVSSITTLMTRVQITSMKQASSMRALRRYLMDNNISKSLSVRVQRNACHAVKRHMGSENDIELLKVISEPLRVELHFEAYSPIFLLHPFIQNYSHLDPSGVRKVCHIGTSAVSISRGDVVFSNMETPVWPRMFFLVTGRLNYFQEGHDDVRLRRGAWACEPVLWTHWMHCGTLVASTDCGLLHLDATKFSMIVSAWPGDHAKHYAEVFVAELNMTDRPYMTDLKTPGVDEGARMAFPDFQMEETEWTLKESIRTSASGQAFSNTYSDAIFSYANSFKNVFSGALEWTLGKKLAGNPQG